MKIKEYSLVKSNDNLPVLKEVSSHYWDGDTVYIDEVYRMLNELFNITPSFVEKSYVVAFDHAKMVKGVCQVGLGNFSETPMPLQAIFTFLMLVGANAFVIAHNHISNMPDASASDMAVTIKVESLSQMFEIEFVGHIIINPNGYTTIGGAINKEKTDSNFPLEEDCLEERIEYLGGGMAATYVLGNRIEGKIEDIKAIFNVK